MYAGSADLSIVVRKVVSQHRVIGQVDIIALAVIVNSYAR